MQDLFIYDEEPFSDLEKLFMICQELHLFEILHEILKRTEMNEKMHL